MKSLFNLAAGVVACLAATCAAAGTYPDRSIRLVVPAAAGGSTDLGARVIGDLLGKELGVPVIVENKGGGGGRIGAAYVASAKPDGYTLLYGNSITNALLPAASRKLNYDAVKDFAPVAQVFWYPTIIACNVNVPFNDLAGLIKYGKEHDGRPVVATAGVGSGNHFSGALLGSMAGINQLFVPYKGNAPAVQDVIAGRADCIHMTELKSYIDAGRLKPIASTGARRDPRFPNVPTVSESGLKGYDATWRQAIFAPAGTPQPVIQKLTAAIEQAVQSPTLPAKMEGSGFVPEYENPQALADLMAKDTQKFRKISQQAHLHLD
ncbi:Bug family tripartite tricarboxylate transporter substrate binding protein [Candidimonas nitroreducens]|uniref:Twin-arginine translocation pathway signal n=1 Tax=Candidimonas nitroreducens TaxID=683354 RepID=A0A225MRR7_9BURK|nr:tripartite tricarboxylate transporter substrate binding protein [Candidimonas nitroreducens]OWT63954.1 hypothetical protein CEY11_06550 [Candidimonas nitroreducens]